MSVSYWLDSSTKKTNYDMIVVGGGIAGTSLCYWLNKLYPDQKIALIERHHLASGASGRNAGFVTCGSIEHLMKMAQEFGLTKALEIWKFSEKNHQLLSEEIVAEEAKNVDYFHTGSCTIAPHEEQWQKYQDFIGVLQKKGVAFEAISPEDVAKDFSLSGFLGGALYKKDGVIHPVKLLKAIFAKTKVDLFEQTEVFNITEASGTVTCSTNRGTFEAAKVFVTTNAYLPLIMDSWSEALVPARGQALTTAPVSFKVRGPCYFTKSLCYFRQLADGSLLVGGFRNIDSQAEETTVDAINPKIQAALISFVQSHFPKSEKIKITHQWSGIMSFSKDGQLLLGPHKKDSSVLIHTGCSGHGMGLNFHAAKVMAESLQNAEAIPDFFRTERLYKELQLS